MCVMEYVKKNCYLEDSCKLDTCNYVKDDDVCIRFFKINFLFDKALLSEHNKKNIRLILDQDGTDRDEYERLSSIQKKIKNWVQTGNNLYLCSSTPGNGKTSWAIKLLKSYILSVWPESTLGCKALFINVPKFLIELKSNISKKSEYIEYINDNVLEADLVIWDDIATKSATEFEHEHLLSLIDNRLFNKKSNIFTSNILPNNLSILIGDRLASRVNSSTVIEFKGKDKRGVEQD